MVIKFCDQRGAQAFKALCTDLVCTNRKMSMQTGSKEYTIGYASAKCVQSVAKCCVYQYEITLLQKMDRAKETGKAIQNAGFTVLGLEPRKIKDKGVYPNEFDD